MNFKFTNVFPKLQLLQLPSSGCRHAILAGTCITEMHSHLALQCRNAPTRRSGFELVFMAFKILSSPAGSPMFCAMSNEPSRSGCFPSNLEAIERTCLWHQIEDQFLVRPVSDGSVAYALMFHTLIKPPTSQGSSTSVKVGAPCLLP